MWEEGAQRLERTPLLVRKQGLLISTFAPPLVENIKSWLQEDTFTAPFGDLIPVLKDLTQKQWLTLVDIALEVAINKEGASRQAVIKEMGHALLYQLGIFNMPPKQYKIVWEYAKSYRPHIVHRIIKENAKQYLEVPDIDAFRLGFRFYALLYHAGLIYETKAPHGRRSVKLMHINPDIIKLLQEKDMPRPFYKPMVVPPIDWRLENGKVVEGGYISLPLQLVHGIKMKAPIKGGEWLDAVNFVQSVPYRVNKDMLDFFEWTLETQQLVFPKPETFVKPIKPSNATPEMKKEFKYRMREYYANRNRAQGLWISYTFTKRLAHEYEDEEMYFPVYVDFRGRMYYSGAYINPQGPDYVKGMLEFAEKKPIETEEGWRWLKIGIANAYGLDKRTYAQRLAWFKENEDLILAIGSNPEDYMHEIRRTSEPYQFVHLCKEYVKALEGEPVGVIVQVDGSNNGTQHLSALQGFNNKYVNMTSEDKVYDIYEVVAKRTYELVQEDTDIHHQREKLFWLEKGVTRSLVKRNVMTYPYSVTFPGMVDQNLEFIMKEYGLGFFKGHIFETVNYITQKIYQALQELVPLDLLKWFQTAVEKIGKPVRWITPSSFEVNQAYWKAVVHRLRTTFGQRTLRVYYPRHSPENGLLKRKMKLAISPNYIHSLDAAHLVKIVQRFQKPILVQHDSFGAHPDHIAELQKIIRETFAEMYSVPILLEQKAFWEKSYGVKLPEPPYRGEFNPEEILKAPYFFG